MPHPIRPTSITPCSRINSNEAVAPYIRLPRKCPMCHASSRGAKPCPGKYETRWETLNARIQAAGCKGASERREMDATGQEWRQNNG